MKRAKPREKESRHKRWILTPASYIASFATHVKSINRKSKHKATNQHHHLISYKTNRENTTTIFMLINDDIEHRKNGIILRIHRCYQRRFDSLFMSADDIFLQRSSIFYLNGSIAEARKNGVFCIHSRIYSFIFDYKCCCCSCLFYCLLAVLGIYRYDPCTRNVYFFLDVEYWIICFGYLFSVDNNTG